MKKKTIIIIFAIIILCIAGWYFFFRTKQAVTVFTTVEPQTGHIAETVLATGTIEPVDTVAVGTQVSGTVSKIFVDFNSVVKKGQLLAELDKTLFNAAVNQAKGNLAQQQSQLTYQEGNLNRETQLYKVGAISKADYDEAVYTYNSAKAAVSSQQATLQTAEQNLALSSIYSPINGTVLSRNVSEGQTVAASFSTPTLFTIAKDLTKMEVMASVNEADVGNIKQGERATFTVDAFLNDTFSGTIQEIRLNPSVSANVVSYTTIINTPNNDLKLKPGMMANIIIYTKEADSALLIPEMAVRFTPDLSIMPKNDTVVRLKDTTANLLSNEQYVWIKQGNTIIQRLIKTGINNNVQVQVLGGLSASDRVITGESRENKAQAASQNSSPFMPFPHHNTKKK